MDFSLLHLHNYEQQLELIEKFDDDLYNLNMNLDHEKSKRLITIYQCIHILLIMYSYIYSFVENSTSTMKMDILNWTKSSLPYFVFDINVIVLNCNLYLTYQRFHALNKTLNILIMAIKKYSKFKRCLENSTKNIFDIINCYVILKNFISYINSGFSVCLLGIFMTTIIDLTNTIFIFITVEEYKTTFLVSLLNTVFFNILNVTLIIMGFHFIQVQVYTSMFVIYF